MNTTKIRKLHPLTLLLVLAVALPACSIRNEDADVLPAPPATSTNLSDPDLPALADASTHVTITFGSPNIDLSVYKPLIDHFMAENTDIAVQIVDPDASHQDVLRADEARLADVVVTSFDRTDTPLLGAQGVWRDMRPFLDADPSFNTSDFYTNTLAATTSDHQTYLIPTDLHVPLIMYNMNIWQQHGLAAPLDWTWPDLRTAAARTTGGMGKHDHIYGWLDPYNGMDALVGELQAQGVDLHASVSTIRFDNPVFIAALENIARAVEDGEVYAPLQSTHGAINSRAIEQQIRAGRLAIFSTDWIGTAPLPFPVGVAPDVLHYHDWSSLNGYAMSGGTQHPEAAWRLISYLSQNEPPRSIPFSVGQIPARKSVAERLHVWDTVDAATQTAIQIMLNRPPPPTPRADSLFAHLSLIAPELPNVFAKKQSAAQAAARAQATFEQQAAQSATPVPTAGPVIVNTPLPQPRAVPETATITFGVSGMDTRDLVDFARRFEEQQPHIGVTVQRSMGGTLANLAATSDCFVAPVVPRAVDTPALRDLQPLIDADADFPRNDIWPRLRTPFQMDGALLGLPARMALPALHYNSDLVGAAPTAQWTLTDLAAAARAQTIGRGVEQQYGVAVLGNQVEAVTTLLRSAGVSLVTRQSDGMLHPTYTDPITVAAVQQIVDLLTHASPHAHLQGATSATDDDVATSDLVAAGQVAFWLDGALVGSSTPAAAHEALAPLPGGHAPVQITGGLYISGQTAQADACWQWMRFVQDQPPTSQEWPVRPSQAQHDSWTQQAPTGAVDVLAAAQPQLTQPQPDDPFDDPSFTPVWFYRALDVAMQGQDLARALADAQATTEAYLACVQNGTDGPACARQVDPTYEEPRTP